MHPEQYSKVFPALILTEKSVSKAGFALNNNRIVHVVLVHSSYSGSLHVSFITAFLTVNLHRVYDRRIGHVDPSYSGSAEVSHHGGDFFTISLAF